MLHSRFLPRKHANHGAAAAAGGGGGERRRAIADKPSADLKAEKSFHE